MTQATSAPCPNCDGTLREQVVKQIHVDVCDGCRGVWFDAGELEDYRVRHGHDGRPGSVLVTYRKEGRRRTCPSCATNTLAERSAAGRPVLHCAGCEGLFLTAGELKGLIARKDESTAWVDYSSAGELAEIPLGILEALGEILAF